MYEFVVINNQNFIYLTEFVKEITLNRSKLIFYTAEIKKITWSTFNLFDIDFCALWHWF